MKKWKLTENDISKELGINNSKVSRALNNSSKVTQKQKIKFLKKLFLSGFKLSKLYLH